MTYYLPRQDMDGWDFDGGASGVPQRALPLTGGSAFLDGDIITRGGLVLPNTGYTPESPVLNTYADNTPKGYGKNHGYGALFSEPSLVESIDSVSKQTEVPSQVLADVLAYTSQGSLSQSPVSVQNLQSISGGVLPYLPSEAEEKGYNPAELTPEQQIRLFLPERIDALRKDERTPHNVLASTLLWNDIGKLRDYVENPAKGDYMNNGVKTLNTALDQLGTHAYRQYDPSVVNPRKALQQRVRHDSYHKGCLWCEGMVRSGMKDTVTPHEAQY